ncbi:MAG TPA: hypothetical protein VD947_01045 [Patescibacteria group bacterium]|nr:hypothetical protein [Patescibacteria group bacterium]
MAGPATALIPSDNLGVFEIPTTPERPKLTVIPGGNSKSQALGNLAVPSHIPYSELDQTPDRNDGNLAAQATRMAIADTFGEDFVKRMDHNTDIGELTI